MDDTDPCAHRDIVSVPSNPFLGTEAADDFEVAKLLGAGGFGVVYQAYFKPLNRIVAVKCLHQSLRGDHASKVRFHRECTVLGQTQHRNIAQVYKGGLLPSGQPYMIMEYLEGHSLTQILQRDGALSQLECLDIFVQVCSAISEAHKANIIHRDIKPSNIFLSEGQVKVLDFGLAKILRDNDPRFLEKLTETRMLIGSPGYMSPEQCLGEVVDERTDIFSVACSLYEALTGTNPFLGRDFYQTLNFQVNKDVSFVGTDIESKLSEQLEHCVLRGLSKDPRDRHESIYEMQCELQSIRDNLRNGGESQSQRASVQRRGKHILRSVVLSHSIKTVAVIICAFGIVGALAFFVRYQIDSQPAKVNSDGYEILVSRDKETTGNLLKRLGLTQSEYDDPNKPEVLIAQLRELAKQNSVESRRLALASCTKAAALYENMAEGNSRYWTRCADTYCRAANLAYTLGEYGQGIWLASRGLRASQKQSGDRPTMLRLLCELGLCQAGLNRTQEGYNTLHTAFVRLNRQGHIKDPTEEDTVVMAMVGFADAYVKLNECDKRTAAANTEAQIELSSIDKRMLCRRFAKAWYR